MTSETRQLNPDALSDLYDALCLARAALWAIEDSAAESGFGKLSDILADRIVECNAAIEKAEAA